MSMSTHYTEETRCFGPGNRLIGTLTLPHTPPIRPLPGLILLNAGVLPRIGPHRLNVELARTAALQGIPAIRFDFPGLGDSGYTTSRLSHDEQALEAIEHAMAQLGGTASKPEQFLIAGLCSGADVGLMMAKRDRRVVGLFMIEPYYYPNSFSGFLRTCRRLREYGFRRSIRRLGQLLANRIGRRPEAAGQEPLPMDPEEGARPTPSREQFISDLSALVSRGVHLELIYANTLMGHFDFRHHDRHIFRHLGSQPHFRVELIPDTDHSFTRVAARQLLVQRMKTWLQQKAHLHATITVPQTGLRPITRPAELD